MLIKNKLLRLFVRVVSDRPQSELSAPKSPQRILAVSTTALGDTLWTMPAIESLRRAFPDAYIAALASKLGLNVLDNNPWTDALYPLDRPLHLWHHLRSQFDTVLIFHASQRLVVPFCASLGAERVIATAGQSKGLDDLLTHLAIPKHQHEVERRLDIIRQIAPIASPPPLSFFIRPEEKIELPGRWIALHPGAKDSYKLWPIKHFASVGRALQKALSCNILITGGASELPLMQELASLIPSAKLSDHTLSLRKFSATLDAIDLLISNDSGPFHLASALQTPALAVYSPTDPALCGPYNCPTSLVCAKPRTCSPCLRRKCREPFCLLQIGPEEVIETALKLFR
ncbi:MAG: glycosyltransferase family 9 protein [Chlamydiae bacterium]|nr:glycosyltransferase family 9 protein [Chlamydiota bacterium]